MSIVKANYPVTDRIRLDERNFTKLKIAINFMSGLYPTIPQSVIDDLGLELINTAHRTYEDMVRDFTARYMLNVFQSLIMSSETDQLLINAHKRAFDNKGNLSDHEAFEQMLCFSELIERGYQWDNEADEWIKPRSP